MTHLYLFLRSCIQAVTTFIVEALSLIFVIATMLFLAFIVVSFAAVVLSGGGISLAAHTRKACAALCKPRGDAKESGGSSASSTTTRTRPAFFANPPKAASEELPSYERATSTNELPVHYYNRQATPVAARRTEYF